MCSFCFLSDLILIDNVLLWLYVNICIDDEFQHLDCSVNCSGATLKVVSTKTYIFTSTAFHETCIFSSKLNFFVLFEYCRYIPFLQEHLSSLKYTFAEESESEALAEFRKDRQKYKDMRRQQPAKGQDRESMTLALLAKFQDKLEGMRKATVDYSDDEEEEADKKEEEEEEENDATDLSW